MQTEGDRHSDSSCCELNEHNTPLPQDVRENRPIAVEAYVVQKLKHDLLSVKELNKTGYQVIHDEDEKESGVFAVNDKKTDKFKSFSFMSKHSYLFP